MLYELGNEICQFVQGTILNDVWDFVSDKVLGVRWVGTLCLGSGIGRGENKRKGSMN